MFTEKVFIKKAFSFITQSKKDMSHNLRLPACLMLLYFFVLVSCKKETTTNENGEGNFVSATSAGTFPKISLQALATLKGFSDYVPFIKYDVEFFKFIYKTTYKGNPVEASGLLGIPKNVPKAPSLLSAQHGTMFNQSDAPSNFPKTFSGFEIGAAAGFVTLIPDFIGYGVSQNIPHPYYIQDYSAQAVVDMIKAAKIFLTNEKIPISNRTFLLGYSEGGYVTMAAQKEIETNKQYNLSLTAVGAGAGGYDISGMLKGIASSPTYAAPSFLALFIKSYDSTYSWNSPYSDFFQEPYASRIPSLLDGTKSRPEIDSALTTSTAALFNPVFHANLSNAKEEIALKQAIAKNSLLNWAPKTPTRLFHGTSDEVVYYETSVTTYNNLKAAGAANIELISIPGGTHETTVKPMILGVLPWFQSLDQ